MVGVLILYAGFLICICHTILCVTLSKLLNVSDGQVPHLGNEDDSRNFFLRFLGNANWNINP